MKVPAEFEGVFQGIELTEREIGFLIWMAGWDRYTMDNLNSVLQKVRAKAIGDVSQPNNEPPPCYQPDGDGCAYQCDDGADEPIDKCKECPLCYSDKQRHHTPPNEPLTIEQLRESPHGKIKNSTLQSICNRANEIASRPPEVSP